ncbi:hypothetical protein PR048_005511 [Dryococelus australis]|uniref:Uncharacterized protein n=1 Tax=Dryococelus australis TaxID=614101 RepID=A0ABQ9I9L0_9NEOP|nr:hypothetical protein PR048_005511 [Dryococelus australis]
MYSIQEVGLSHEVNPFQADTNKTGKKLCTTSHFPTAVVCQIDSGATCNAISIQDLQRVTGEAKSKLNKSTTVLKYYANTQIIPLGQKILQFTYEGLTSGKITEDDIRQEFKGLGQISVEVQLNVKDDAKPQQAPPRCVPIPHTKELNIVLQQLEQQVIVQETEPTDRVSSMVIV